MRRRPQQQRDPLGLPLEQLGPQQPSIATTRGDVIEPFLVSGGATFFLVVGDDPPTYDPRPAGFQLVAGVYVPKGRIGFLKQLRVAPFIPPQLADPWTTSGPFTEGGSWRTFDVPFPIRAGGTNGVWTTPFGWEGCFNNVEPPLVSTPAQWTWQLRLCAGDVMAGRAAAFDVTNPLTWQYVQSTPVPINAYPNGLPGYAPGNAWGPQRMQVLQADELDTHVVIPPHTTLCLFTRWSQGLFQPGAALLTEGGYEEIPYGLSLYPLLPSFGQLHGYMQASDNSDASIENALYGWGG